MPIRFYLDFLQTFSAAGPMMLLELCDMTLKEWLNENPSLTVAMLDDILMFALNIAGGVEFLHSKHVMLTTQQILLLVN